MREIRSILNIAARRLEIASFLSKAHLITVVLAIVVVMMLAAERIGPETFFAWTWILPLSVAAGLAVAGRLWYVARRSELQVAIEVDDRLDLHEKLSTALHCTDRDDAFARTAVADAVRTAGDPRVREQVSRRFNVQPPRRWWLSPALVALAVALWFVPPLDLFAADDPVVDPNLASAQQQRDEAIDAVIKQIKDDPELRKEFSDLMGELSNEGIDPKAPRSREEVKRNAIKKLTDLNKRLDEIISGSKGKTAESLEKSLRQLKTPEDGPAKDLADAMAKGDFAAAQKALQKLLAEAQNGDMDDEQKKKLAQQLQDLAQQMEQLAQQQQELEQLLQQAGMNPQLAGDPQALQQAIQNNPNLNQQQQQQLMQMAQAQQAAAQMCQGMGQAMQQMAQAMQAGQLGQFGQAGQQMGNQLNQLEAMQMMLKQARAAANMAQGQCKGLGQGLALQQAMQKWRRGGAFGNRGWGEGGKAPIQRTPSGTKIEQARTKTTSGDIIARWLVQGPQITGQSQAKLKQVSAVVAEGYEEGLTEDQLPRRYHEPQKHYFGELKKFVEAVERTTEEPADAATEDESQSDD